MCWRTWQWCWPAAAGRKRRCAKPRRAITLNPNHPAWYFGALGIAQLVSGDPGGAVASLKAWIEVNPTWHVPYLFLIAAQANAGNQAAAEETLKRFIALRGFEMHIGAVAKKWPMAEKEAAIFHKGLRTAGMKD